MLLAKKLVYMGIIMSPIIITLTILFSIKIEEIEHKKHLNQIANNMDTIRRRALGLKKKS